MTENKLICPFCQQELKELYNNGISVGFRCKNKNCPETNIMCGTKMLWQALIDTKKKLDKSIDLLEMLYGDYNLDWAVVDSDKVYDFLEQINKKEQQ